MCRCVGSRNTLKNSHYIKKTNSGTYPQRGLFGPFVHCIIRSACGQKLPFPGICQFLLGHHGLGEIYGKMTILTNIGHYDYNRRFQWGLYAALS